MIETMIARLCPLIEPVRRRGSVNIAVLTAAGKSRLLVGTDTHRWTLSTGFAFASPHRDDGLIRIGINIETIVARLDYSERLIGRVNFIGFAIVQTPHMQVHGALV